MEIKYQRLERQIKCPECGAEISTAGCGCAVCPKCGTGAEWYPEGVGWQAVHPPAGWRLLGEGEDVEPGDMPFDYQYGWESDWHIHTEIDYAGPGAPLIARRIDTAETEAPPADGPPETCRQCSDYRQCRAELDVDPAQTLCQFSGPIFGPDDPARKRKGRPAKPSKEPAPGTYIPPEPGQLELF